MDAIQTIMERVSVAERKQETQKLYNPFRNLYLDKCYGDSKIPLGAWMNFTSEE